MAATTSNHWVYPPNYQAGDYPKNNNGTIGPKRWIIQLLGEATGAEDESNVIKVDLSDLVTPDGNEPEKMIIDKITYDITGFTGVHLSWDRAPANHRFFSMSGANNGKVDYRRSGGYVDNETGGTGDVLLSTQGGGQYDVYNILLEFRVK